MKKLALSAIAGAIALMTAAAQPAPAVVITSTYSQNFDSMGTAGTAAPTDWAVFALSGSHDTFHRDNVVTAGDAFPNATATAIAGGTAKPTLTVNTGPSNSSSANGLNVALTASTSDRALGSAPTGVSGMILQLTLTNGSGAPVNSLNIGYDIRHFTTTTNNNTGYDTSAYKGIEEFPGYQLFYSLDNGTTFTNFSDLNPTIAGPGGVVVPNGAGVTNVSATETLASSWANGSNLILRWFDDNAQSPSPDQILGLDNVSVGVPEPASVGLLVCGAAALIRRRRSA